MGLREIARTVCKSTKREKIKKIVQLRKIDKEMYS